MYPNHTNIAPRIALAYAPHAESRLAKFFFGSNGRTSIRMGAGMFHDLIGQPLAQTYDSTAFGLQTNIANASGQLTALTAPRFTSFFDVPKQLIRPADPGGFPVTYPNSFAITNSIDDNLKQPYTINMNFSMSREFGRGLFVQGSYVGPALPPFAPGAGHGAADQLAGPDLRPDLLRGGHAAGALSPGDAGERRRAAGGSRAAERCRSSRTSGPRPRATA